MVPGFIVKSAFPTHTNGGLGRIANPNFKIVFARGYGGEWNYTVIPVEHPLISYLGNEKEALDIEKVKALI
jgi:hypothetical protein